MTTCRYCADDLTPSYGTCSACGGDGLMEMTITAPVLNALFLSLHYAVEECVAGRFSRDDLEATRDKVFSEYQGR